MKLNEEQLRDIVKETIAEALTNEELFGLSFSNFAKNGHFHVNSKSKNPVIQTAWRNGWELEKDDNDESRIDGVYQAKIMDGTFNNYEPDQYPYDEKYPKVSWPMLIAILNKQFRAAGYVVKASNYRESFEDLFGRENNKGGARAIRGTVTVIKKV